jgi:hypothetical protein
MVSIQVITETNRHGGILSTARTMTRPNWRDAVAAAEEYARQQAKIAYRRREGRTVAHVTLTGPDGVTIRHRWAWN